MAYMGLFRRIRELFLHLFDIRTNDLGIRGVGISFQKLFEVFDRFLVILLEFIDHSPVVVERGYSWFDQIDLINISDR